MKLTLFLLSSLIFITGCSSNNGLSTTEKNLAFQNYISINNLEEVDKITSFRFHGWSSLTNEYLIISSSHKRQHLLELTGFCSEISWAHAIVINRSTSSTLHAKFDSISTAKAPRIKCMIKNIYPLTDQQEEDIKSINNSDNEQEPDATAPNLSTPEKNTT